MHKTIVVLAVGFATVTGALAATKHPVNHPRSTSLEATNSYVGVDPDANVRFEMRRDPNLGRW
jgi:hypothetical protein